MKTKLAFLGYILATLTLVSGIGLLSLSGWFISATAFAGLSLATSLAFNYFLPSAGVRFFSMLRILSRYLERIVTHEVTFKTLSDLRVAAYTALEPLAPAHLLRDRSGTLLNRMVTDVDTLDQLYIRIITPLFAAIAMVMVLAFYLHYFSWILTALVCGIFILSLIFIPLLLAGLGKQIGLSQSLQQEHLRTYLVESIQGMGELIMLDQWQTHLTKIDKTSQTLIRTQFKMTAIQGLANSLLLLLSGLTLTLVIYIATPLVQQHTLNGANLALLALTAFAAFEAIAPISIGAQYWSKIQLANHALKSLKNSKPSVTFPTHSSRTPTQYHIEFDQVSFSYQTNQPILKNYNLKIAAGEHFVLKGPSGSGKSTILHLLARCFNPSQGEIRIGNIPIQSLAESDLRALMSLITQRPHLFSATLRENLCIAQPDAPDSILLEALEQVQLKTWYDGLENGLNTWLGEAGIQLSGGQLRRLSVARALLHNAPIWLLDEPTEGLDAATEKAFWQALTPLMQGRTVLLVSHHKAI